MARLKTHEHRCAMCGGGSPGIHTGPVPPIDEIRKRGPVKLRDMDFSVVVCSVECADTYRIREHAGRTEAPWWE